MAGNRYSLISIGMGIEEWHNERGKRGLFADPMPLSIGENCIRVKRDCVSLARLHAVGGLMPSGNRPLRRGILRVFCWREEPLPVWKCSRRLLFNRVADQQFVNRREIHSAFSNRSASAEYYVAIDAVGQERESKTAAGDSLHRNTGQIARHFCKACRRRWKDGCFCNL